MVRGVNAVIEVVSECSVGHVLNEFVRSAALPYLEDDNADVRRAGALTCCKLFVRDPICYQASSHAIEIISDVLDKLLTVGIADPGGHRILGPALVPDVFLRPDHPPDGALVPARTLRQAPRTGRECPLHFHIPQ